MNNPTATSALQEPSVQRRTFLTGIYTQYHTHSHNRHNGGLLNHCAHTSRQKWLKQKGIKNPLDHIYYG